MAPVFIDSNIPMYLVGAQHPNKVQSRAVLHQLLVQGRSLVTDAEVFQEILHRFHAIRRLDAIEPAFRALREIVDDVYPVTLPSVERGRSILESHAVSARDAIHVAVMEANEVEEIFSFDPGFDSIPLVRLVGR